MHPMRLSKPNKKEKVSKRWDFSRVKELEAWPGAETDDDESDKHSIVIAENVTAAEFYAKIQAKDIGCKVALQNGNLIIYELSKVGHGKVGSQIIGALFNWNQNVANDSCSISYDANMDVTPVGAPAATIRRPDVLLIPDNLPAPAPGLGMNADNDPYPTFVAEVGISETIGSLHGLADEYFDPRTTIRVYLAVKIWPMRPNGTFAAIALLYLRNNVPNTTPAQVISFGTAPIHAKALTSMPPVIPPLIVGNHGIAPQVCNAAGLPAFQINLPTAELYHGVPGVPNGVPVGVPAVLPLDLFQLQRAAYR